MRRIFCGWASEHDMSQNRRDALISILVNTGCNVVFLNRRNMYDWQLDEYPFHPAFQYLNDSHKMDYLRMYTMHCYGGGYTDIKSTDQDWNPFFNILEKSDNYGVGYTEIGPGGVATIGGELEKEMQHDYKKLIGICSIIFKRQTDFTKEWYNRTHDMLDSNLEKLKSNPAKGPTDSKENKKGYPIKWTGVGGDIFHPLVFENFEKIIHVPMQPSFRGYQ